MLPPRCARRQEVEAIGKHARRERAIVATFFEEHFHGPDRRRVPRSLRCHRVRDDRHRRTRRPAPGRALGQLHAHRRPRRGGGVPDRPLPAHRAEPARQRPDPTDGCLTQGARNPQSRPGMRDRWQRPNRHHGRVRRSGAREVPLGARRTGGARACGCRPSSEARRW